MSAMKFHVGDRVEDKEAHKRGYVTSSTASLNVEARLSRFYSTAAMKQSMSRLTAFAKSQRGSHECSSDVITGNNGCCL
jgi:hypothetical protein